MEEGGSLGLNHCGERWNKMGECRLKGWFTEDACVGVV